MPNLENFSSQLKAFNELVAMKYQVYNGLFLTLPFEEIENTGAHLSYLASNCKTSLEAGETPQEIIDKFLKNSSSKHKKILFKILQFVERQIVLFDALEDAAFQETHDLLGLGTLENLLNNIKAQNKQKEFESAIKNYKTRLVLTAHPTQFYPNAILGIITDLSLAIKKNDLIQIRNLLLQMGKTPFSNKHKPSPLDEAKSLVWYLENVFYETLPNIQKHIFKPAIELGFWPGGDRDGNPFVNAQTTQEVASILKNSILSLYLKDIQLLKRRLTFDGISQKLLFIEEKLQSKSKSEICQIKNTIDYKNALELLADLQSLKNNLIQNHQSLFLDELNNLIIKVQIFGFHFASLDLRQDSRIHTQALSELIQNSNYINLNVSDKIQILKQIILSPNSFDGKLSNNTKDVLESLQIAKEIQASNGSQGLHRYIISNTQSEANILEIMAFAIKAGWLLEELNLDIVPLFETINDLENAEATMQVLYKDEVYKAHLKRRNNEQIIMLGFSDGTKDGGYIAANWAIYKAKEKLTQISRQAGIKVIFFDGRGGPPARGGGNTHRFYRSLGSSIEQEQIHLTIQGQTISSNFGISEAAQYNFEQIFTAGLEQKIFSEKMHEINQEEKSLIEELALSSYKAYLELRNHKLFLPYLEEATPLNYYNDLNIGSRPARRKTKDKAQFEDLRAIPFVGAWTQMKQNIPGFYGLGSGLQALIKKGHLENLKMLYKNCLFFQALLDNAMQSLSKSYFPLTYYLKENAKFSEFWNLLYAEAKLTEKLLKEISGQEQLLQNAEVSRQSITLREKIILPLLVIQHYAMSFKDKNEVHHKIISKSLAANVNASRNSV